MDITPECTRASADPASRPPPRANRPRNGDRKSGREIGESNSARPRSISIARRRSRSLDGHPPLPRRSSRQSNGNRRSVSIKSRWGRNAIGSASLAAPLARQTRRFPGPTGRDAICAPAPASSRRTRECRSGGVSLSAGGPGISLRPGPSEQHDLDLGQRHDEPAVAREVPVPPALRRHALSRHRHVGANGVAARDGLEPPAMPPFVRLTSETARGTSGRRRRHVGRRSILHVRLARNTQAGLGPAPTTARA